MKGTVTNFRWANPHAQLYFDEEKNGEVIHWAAEMNSPGVLTRDGWTIRTVKPGCGAPASGFIASHHARGNNSAELVARKICPKMRRSRRLSPRRASMRVGNLGSAHAAQRISRMLRPGGTQLAATITATRTRRTRVDNTAIPARATSTSFGTHQGVPRCACANAMRGLASQPAPRCRPRFVVVISAI